MTRLSWFRPHRRGFILVTGLLVIEQVAWLFEPGVFGRVIDALLAHQNQSRSLEYLLVHLSEWLVIFVSNSLAGIARRASTARVSTQFYASLIDTITELALRNHEPPERTAAKTEISRELVVFFETQMPLLVAGVMNVVGALIALYMFDHRIATACLALVLPLGFVNRWVNRRLNPLESAAHDLRERAFGVFAARDPRRVREHFASLGLAQRRIARLTNINFASLRVVLLAVFVTVLYIAIDIDNFTTGRLYAVVSYLWNFVAYAEDFPQLIESGSSLSDLLRRLGGERAPAPVAQVDS
jgi:ABC-type multidrug transport system fused ATPase/permease subunit